MHIDAVLGNEPFRQAARQMLSARRLPHALLISAPDGCGRGFAARCLAADILYPQGGAAAAGVLRGESPELLLVQGEGKSGQIPVERVREVRQDVHMSALSAEGRVVWIRDAHRMAAPAANALLKVLEEPPAGVIFLLTVRDASSVPLTILSRCTQLSLEPVPLDMCRTALQDAAPADTNPALLGLLAVVYGGRIGLGLRALRDESRLQTLQDALAVAKALSAENRYEALKIFAAYEGRADGDRERRDALLADLADVIETSLWGGQAPGLPVFDTQTAARMLPKIQDARAALTGNAAPKITFTALVALLASVW